MNIALIGYGKMGVEIEQIATKRGHTITQRFIDVDPVTLERLRGNDCCIDFSTASAIQFNVTSSLSLGIPIVIGTTGWNNEMNDVRALVDQYNGALVYGSNFSLGANIFFKLAEDASKIFNTYTDYDVAVHETHHNMKKDAPSGTALTVANKVLQHFLRKQKISTLPTNIKPDELLVSSSRIGSVVGEHTVRFNSLADDIILTHNAHNRSGFALGAVLAAEWIVSKKGFFTFEELLWSSQ